jgi:hypothetical protein
VGNAGRHDQDKVIVPPTAYEVNAIKAIEGPEVLLEGAVEARQQELTTERPDRSSSQPSKWLERYRRSGARELRSLDGDGVVSGLGLNR